MQSALSKAAIAIIAAVAWFSLILQLYLLIDNAAKNGQTIPEAIGRFFLFFTILSNLLVAISLTSLLLFRKTIVGRFFSNPVVITGIAVYIVIVCLGYNFLLCSVWNPEGLLKLADELLHVFIPISFIIYWI